MKAQTDLRYPPVYNPVGKERIEIKARSALCGIEYTSGSPSLPSLKEVPGLRGHYPTDQTSPESPLLPKIGFCQSLRHDRNSQRAVLQQNEPSCVLRLSGTSKAIQSRQSETNVQ